VSIIALLNQIKAEEIVLPAIQREFVWPHNKIKTLMDSVMRGYPIGIVLMWETYNDIQFRRFEETYRSGVRPVFLDNSDGKKLRIVLDGQQRLQSLYLALYGQYDSEYLYFDLLSGRDSDDSEEEKYAFAFAEPADATVWNAKSSSRQSDGDGDQDGVSCWIRVGELFRMDVAQRMKYRRRIAAELALTDRDEVRLDTNMAKLDEVLAKDENILRTSIIDENKPLGGASRQSEADVLEIFVRINRQGTPLSRSDLIFSMLKLNWRESATALPDFVDGVNEGNSFEIDVDFVIRCLFAVSDLGTKFDIDLLRRKSNIQKMQANFDKCCAAIQATVDHVQKHCWMSSSRAFGGNSNLVPFVYYLSYMPKHDVPNSQIADFRKAFFLFAFAGPFSRYADSRLAKFIREALLPLREAGETRFPLEAAVRRIYYWEDIDGWNEQLIRRNVRLALHILQRDAGGRTHRALNKREMDHIFPRSILIEKGIDETKVNHFANFWLLAKGKNINKTNKHPKKYFEDVPDNDLSSALIDRDKLDYRSYSTFIERRGQQIVAELGRRIGITAEDFSVLRDG
jgi:hypothetical protein